MNIALLWQGLLTMAAFLTGMAAHPGDPMLWQKPQHGHERPAAPNPTASPSPSASPSPTMTPRAHTTPGAHVTPRPSGSPAATATPTASPTATATPKQAPEVKSGELASEKVCPDQSDTTKTAAALACLTTYARTLHGLPAVQANSQLMAAATAKDQDMVKCGMSHTACGRDAGYWVTNKGYTGHCTGENIAEGQKTPREVFAAWMASPGHRANILNKSYKDLGVAEASGSHGPMWAMELGGC